RPSMADDELFEAVPALAGLPQNSGGAGLESEHFNHTPLEDRKVGVPPGWASQVKVVALSVFTAGIGWAMFSFMANMSIGQLELGHPRNAGTEAVQCFLPTRETDRHLRKLLLRLRHRERTPELECHVKNMVNKTCSDVEVPVASINGHMVPMAGGVDWLRWWAKVFLVLSLLLLLGITTHDLAMLSLVKQEEIMDFRSLRWQFPVIRRSFALLAGVKVIRQLLQKSGLGRWAQLLSRLGMPFLVVWNLCLAVFVLSPLCVALFLLHPIRLSRAAVFVQSLVCSVYSLCFLVQITVWLLHRHWRPWYALTWSHAGVISDRKVDCLCGCEYSVSNHALFQLMMIAVTSLAKSLMVAMRCVKGLRRSQWANLITVLFSVPINAYPVTWASLDAEPPEGCDETETQGERAFDPFVLMDEQINSKNLRLELAAIQWQGTPRGGDVTPREADAIGCCGFPYARRRRPKRWSLSFAVALNFKATMAPDLEEEDLRTQVEGFLSQLPPKDARQVLDRLRRRLAAGEPLSARKVADHVDESCEFLAELLAFCRNDEVVAEVLHRVGEEEAEEEQLLGRFLDSRRRRRLEPVRTLGPWEEHFAGGRRYFYNNDTQKTQWHVPNDWPAQVDAASAEHHSRRDFEITLVDAKEFMEFTPGILRAFVRPSHFESLSFCLEPVMTKMAVTFLAGEVKKLEFENGQVVAQIRPLDPRKAEGDMLTPQHEHGTAREPFK
ncbi:unnamed protein product, partial [Effrenium voratum]